MCQHAWGQPACVTTRSAAINENAQKLGVRHTYPKETSRPPRRTPAVPPGHRAVSPQRLAAACHPEAQRAASSSGARILRRRRRSWADVLTHLYFGIFPLRPAVISRPAARTAAHRCRQCVLPATTQGLTGQRQPLQPALLIQAACQGSRTDVSQQRVHGDAGAAGLQRPDKAMPVMTVGESLFGGCFQCSPGRPVVPSCGSSSRLAL